MKSRSKLALTALAAALALSACKKEAEAPATPADGAQSTTRDIPGLKDEKAQVSYVLGMNLGKPLAEIKDEIDLSTVVRGLRDELNGKAVVNEEQAREIMGGFMERMQAKMLAEHMAKARKNAEEGQKFLTENARAEGVKTTASGLQYKVLQEAEGAKPGESDVVRVHYTGKLLDGTTFDSSKDRGEPAEFPLAGVIPGWSEGLRLMSKGSKYQFWIPAALAYGEQPPPGAPIPPNATLVFEVELLDINKAGAPSAPAR